MEKHFFGSIKTRSVRRGYVFIITLILLVTLIFIVAIAYDLEPYDSFSADNYSGSYFVDDDFEYDNIYTPDYIRPDDSRDYAIDPDDGEISDEEDWDYADKYEDDEKELEELEPDYELEDYPDYPPAYDGRPQPPITPNLEPGLFFSFESELRITPLMYLQYGRDTALLRGVRVVDELNTQLNNAWVQDDGGFDITAEPNTGFTVTYAAAHPETSEVFTASRTIFVCEYEMDETIEEETESEAGASITFVFTEGEHGVIIEDISAIPDATAFVLEGVSAKDEHGESVYVEIASGGNLLLENGSFDLNNIMPGAQFTVLYRAVHPVSGEAFTVSRGFSLPHMIARTGLRIIDSLVNENIVVSAGETVIIVAGGHVNGMITVNTGGILEMENGAITGNPALPTTPAVLMNGGEFTMRGGEIHSNQGGGVSVGTNSLFTMDGGRIRGNSSTGNGGGVAVLSGGEFNLHSGEIRENTGANGGGIFVAVGGNITVDNYVPPSMRSVVEGNTASGNGGGIWIGGSRSVIDLRGINIANNTAQDGGGLFLSNSVNHLYVGTITANRATRRGGGIFANGAVGNGAKGTGLHSGTISYNTANNQGGGIFSNHTNEGLRIEGLPGQMTAPTHNMQSVQIIRNTVNGNTGVNTSGGGRVVFAYTRFEDERFGFNIRALGALGAIADRTTVVNNGVVHIFPLSAIPNLRPQDISSLANAGGNVFTNSSTLAIYWANVVGRFNGPPPPGENRAGLVVNAPRGMGGLQAALRFNPELPGQYGGDIIKNDGTGVLVDTRRSFAAGKTTTLHITGASDWFRVTQIRALRVHSVNADYLPVQYDVISRVFVPPGSNYDLNDFIGKTHTFVAGDFIVIEVSIEPRPITAFSLNISPQGLFYGTHNLRYLASSPLISLGDAPDSTNPSGVGFNVFNGEGASNWSVVVEASPFEGDDMLARRLRVGGRSILMDGATVYTYTAGGMNPSLEYSVTWDSLKLLDTDIKVDVSDLTEIALSGSQRAEHRAMLTWALVVGPE